MTLLGRSIVPETPAKAEKSKFVLSPIPVLKLPTREHDDTIVTEKASDKDQRARSCILFSSTEIQGTNPQVISPSKSGSLVSPEDGSPTSSDDSDPQHSPMLRTTPIWLSSDVNFFLEDIILTNYSGEFFLNTFSVVEVIGKGSFAEVLHVRDAKDVHFAVKRTVKPFTGISDRRRRIQEALNMTKVSGHVNCLKLYNSWEQSGFLYLQTELASAVWSSSCPSGCFPSRRAF